MASDEIARLMGFDKAKEPGNRWGKVSSISGAVVNIQGGLKAVKCCACAAGDIVVLVPVSGQYAAIAKRG